jgi:multiple sugar transport system permease protein
MYAGFKSFLLSFLPDSAVTLLAPLLFVAAILCLLFLSGMALVKKKVIRRTTFSFYMFISPWLIGFFIFTLFPLIYSFVISFSRWSMMGKSQFIGLANYVRAFSGEDRWFWKSIQVTAYYSFLYVPVSLIFSFIIAVLLNQKVRGMRVFRTAYYLPSLVSGVALSTLWLYIFNYNFGLLNSLLRILHLEPQKWLLDAHWVIPSFVFMGLWGLGGCMVIFLAGLQDVPPELYEAAAIDGAGAWKKFTRITIPFMTPMIFFNLVMGIIGSFQIFTQAFVMTKGGPNGASMFYIVNLYNYAFERFEMGYASALAWILFVILLILTSLVFRSSSLWVFYENEVRPKRKPRGKVSRREGYEQNR